MKLLSIGMAIGLVVGGFSMWAIVGGEPDGPRSDEQSPRRRDVNRAFVEDEDEDAPRGAPTTLAECRQSLVAKEVEIRAVRATAARAVAGALVSDDDDAPGEPGAAAHRTEGGDGEDPAARAARRAEREHWREASKKVREALVEELGVTQDEEQSLADAVCPQRENERSLYYQYADGSLDVDGLFTALAQERHEATRAMRQSLGKGRFAKLRRVGGLPVLSRTLCRGGGR